MDATRRGQSGWQGSSDLREKSRSISNQFGAKKAPVAMARHAFQPLAVVMGKTYEQSPNISKMPVFFKLD